jgi:hypothetical protein
MNAEIQAAVVFAERLGVDVQSDFQRHHRHRKPPGRIDENPSTAVSLNLESFFSRQRWTLRSALIKSSTTIPNKQQDP